MLYSKGINRLLLNRLYGNTIKNALLLGVVVIRGCDYRFTDRTDIVAGYECFKIFGSNPRKMVDINQAHDFETTTSRVTILIHVGCLLYLYD